MTAKSFLKLETRPGEALVGSIASEAGLIKVLNNLFDEISDTEAIEVHVYHRCVLIGIREKGHGDKMLVKFTNFGFHRDSPDKVEALEAAIRSIDSGSLPDYCYKALDGDVEALRKTTCHLVRAYSAKVRRMQEKGKSAVEIEPYILAKDTAIRRLGLRDEDLVSVSEPIIIEIPKQPAVFYDDYDEEIDVVE